MEQVSLRRVSSYQKNLTENLVLLLEPLGGLAAFAKRGEKVFLKPNLVLARPIEKAVNTHPAVILAVAGLLLELGCRVAVGDSPGIGSAEGVIRKLGLCDQLKKMGIPVIELVTETPALNRSFPFQERQFKNLRLAAELNDYDRIINLPKLKSHGQMGLTLATKNLFGCVAGTAKPQWHYAVGNNPALFARLLVEVAVNVNADLHIVDGIMGMDGNGPSNGRPRPLNMMAAGSNPVAVDRAIVAVLGKKERDIPIFAAAQETGIPGADLSEIHIYDDSAAGYRVDDFEIPSLMQVELAFGKTVINRILKSVLDSKIRLERRTCIRCQECIRQCPAGAITDRNGIVIHHDQCIKCCCCQEICPVGALSVAHSPGMKILKKLGLVD